MRNVLICFCFLIISFLLTSCFGFPSRKDLPGGGGGSAPDDNWLLYISEIMLWAAIASLIAGGVIIAILKRPMLGFQTFGLGAIFLVWGFVLRFIDSHIEIFIGLFIISIAGTAYLIHKAVTIGVPWFERWTNIDWNRDGNKGTIVKPRPDPGQADDAALDPVTSNSDKTT